MKCGSFRASVRDRDANQDVIGIGFRVFHYYIEISALVKNSRVDQFEFRFLPGTMPILFQEALIWKF